MPNKRTSFAPSLSEVDKPANGTFTNGEENSVSDEEVSDVPTSKSMARRRSLCTMLSTRGRVRVDVGGHIFGTRLSTLTLRRAAGSQLSRLFEHINADLDLDDDAGVPTVFFLDRDPRCFEHILQWLRDSRPIVVPTLSEKDRLLSELQWYGPFIGGDPVVLSEEEYGHVRAAAHFPVTAMREWSGVAEAGMGGPGVAAARPTVEPLSPHMNMPTKLKFYSVC